MNGKSREVLDLMGSDTDECLKRNQHPGAKCVSRVSDEAPRGGDELLMEIEERGGAPNSLIVH
jgi:hypothetical protein